MDNLLIEGTINTPKIDFDASTNLLKIWGRSIPEHPINFYTPIEKWIDAYLASFPETITLEIYLDYLNTHSTECMYILLKKLADYQLTSLKNVNVIWFYDEDDEDMESMGEDLSDIVKLPIELKTL
ncbi:MAG: DUF1987 domain-containing protein [Vicingaceae bacterium]|nr:DUF1987 domain-containing protein [Vicingaceae bacterium]